ncbi:MAG: bifunctional 5,10-methylenetetrahydrofolate dehydrogenase/5,10-methenyltetrahydrofolate cyclohydrolase [Halobacteriovoraceae bacterium]|nr:bifunctional 5,10-methylenetetrahydrofolate dehydrogenase/5,10-methenyltetrahydrofolate cyclohydrolase [Halobacteriovoraceae bacterium]
MKLLDAKSIIERNIPNLQDRAQQLTSQGLVPSLSVVLVGNNQASRRYVNNKAKFCKRIGVVFNLIELPQDISKETFLDTVDKINNDPSVTGCFVQLPVPKHLSNINITQLINPAKDVDGFHLNTINKLYLNELDGIIPCTPKGIITLLNENNIKIEGMNVTIIGRSHIVGKPLSLLFQALNATVTLCHSRTKDLKKHTINADIIVAASGVPHIITADHVNSNQSQVVIDVGMNQLDGKLVGDVYFAEVVEKVRAITPVPGGVGPMTVYSLMENLLLTTENIINKGI